MSVANIICQGSRGYLLSDRGLFHADGTVAALECKTLELPALRAAIVARGFLRARDQIAAGVQAYGVRDVGALLEVLPVILHDYLRAAGALASPEARASFATELSIVYVRPDTGRAAGALLSSTTIGMPDGYAPFHLLPVIEATSPGVDFDTLFGRAVDASDPASFDIDRDGVRLMEAQRAQTWGFNGVAAGHHCAGGVDLTAVSAAGVSTRSLADWPDVIGRAVRLSSEP